MTDKAMSFSYLDSDYLKIGIIGPKQAGKSTYALALCDYLNKKPIIFAKSYSKYMKNLIWQIYFLSDDINSNQHIIEATKNISFDNIIIFDEIVPCNGNYNYIHICQTISGINNYNNIITCYNNKDYLNIIYNCCTNIGLKLDYSTFENTIDITPYTFNLINSSGIYSSTVIDNKIVAKCIDKSYMVQDIVFNKNFTGAIIGERGCGKFTLILNILKNIENTIDKCIIYDYAYDDDKYTFMKNLNYEIKNNIDIDELDDIIKCHKNNVDKHMVIIIHNFVVQKIFNEKIILDLVTNSRYYNVSIIFVVKYPLSFPPEIRCQFDYIFMYNDEFISNKKRLYDHYGGRYESFNNFNKVLSNINKYDSLLFDHHKPKIVSQCNNIKLTKKLDKLVINKRDATKYSDIIKELQMIREKCDIIEKYILQIKN